MGLSRWLGTSCDPFSRYLVDPNTDGGILRWAWVSEGGDMDAHHRANRISVVPVGSLDCPLSTIGKGG